MRVISMTCQKGGVGKSTLARNLAVAATLDGETVLAIDIDKQGTLTKWRQRRTDKSISVLTAQPADLPTILARARATGSYSLVIVDTPGIHGPDLGVSLQGVEMCLVPIQPSIDDLEAVQTTIDALKRLSMPYAVVVNAAEPRSPQRILEIANALITMIKSNGGWLVPGFICRRSDYQDATTLGMGVAEFNPTGKAAQEVNVLWNWIKNILKEEVNGKTKAA